MQTWYSLLGSRNELLEAADERLRSNYNTKEMACVMYLRLCCCHPAASEQPSIRLVRKALKF
jgi:hypothetical protein